jgi:hypothetical protein
MIGGIFLWRLWAGSRVGLGSRWCGELGWVGLFWGDVCGLGWLDGRGNEG